MTYLRYHLSIAIKYIVRTYVPTCMYVDSLHADMALHLQQRPTPPRVVHPSRPKEVEVQPSRPEQRRRQRERGRIRIGISLLSAESLAQAFDRFLDVLVDNAPH